MRDAFDKLKGHKVTVFGLSMDSVEKQKEFSSKHELPYDLIADTDGKIAKALGVPLKMAGKFTARQAYLFKDGMLVWKDENGATATQGEDVLKAISSSK